MTARVSDLLGLPAAPFSPPPPEPVSDVVIADTLERRDGEIVATLIYETTLDYARRQPAVATARDIQLQAIREALNYAYLMNRGYALGYDWQRLHGAALAALEKLGAEESR